MVKNAKMSYINLYVCCSDTLVLLSHKERDTTKLRKKLISEALAKNPANVTMLISCCTVRTNTTQLGGVTNTA